MRLVEPFGVGGGPDLIARVLAEPLGVLLGHQVTVENHPGAGSTAGPALVATARADGQTLLVNTSAHAYSAMFRESLPYDPLEDFTPLGGLTTQPYVLIASTRCGVTTLTGLSERSLRFSSSGVGTATHVGVAKLNRLIGVDAVHIPAGGSNAITDTIGEVVAGRTDYALSPISIALPHIRRDRLVPLGVSTSRRSRLLPDVPALGEIGAPDFDFPVWYGLWGPAGIPQRTINLVAGAIAEVLVDAPVQKRLRAHDAEPMPMTPTEFAQFVRDESEAAARIIGAT